MKIKLDRYSLLIISKYFKTCDDFINVMLTNKKFEDLVDMFHYNPIPIDGESIKLFTNIETQYIYNKYDGIIPNLFNYIVWYPSDVKTIKFFEKRYQIRPILKKLYVDYSFLESGDKKEGDIIFISDFAEGRIVVIGFLDCSGFVGMRVGTFCYSLIKKIKLGKHIHSIPSRCFDKCSLIEIDLSNVTKIEESFKECNLLTSITFSKHLETMDINCFKWCSSLKTITISDNSKEFGLDLSYELYQVMKSNGIKCTGNVWIINNEGIPTDIDCKIIKTKELINQKFLKFDLSERLSANLFTKESYSLMKHIILSPTVIFLDSLSFVGMISLESINLENVKHINFGCFMGCIKLKEVNIYNTKSLALSAFERCSYLTSVTYSSYLNYIPKNCFFECFKLKEIKGMEHINIISQNCFVGCKKLKFDTLPKKLIRIGSSNGSRFKIKSINEDCLIQQFEESCFKGNTTLESIYISKSIFMNKRIRSSAFSYCTSLKEIRIEGINSIDGTCFKKCYSLSTIELPSTLKTIKKYCFENCFSLKEIIIPSSVEYIKKNVFKNCTSLTKVDFGSGKANISSGVFEHCPLKEINLINGNKMKGWFCYEHYLILKSKGIDVTKVEYTRSDRRKYGNIIPECCCKIGERAFEKCSMKELTIPSNIKTLGYNCFNKCQNLNEMHMGGELKKIIKSDVYHNMEEYPHYPFVATLKCIKNGISFKLYENKQHESTFPFQIIEI